MEYRTLGTTDLQVSSICLGTWEMSGAWGPDYGPAIRAVGRAFEQGITFYDTAYAYGAGQAESALAQGLGDLIRTHRDEVVLVTKGGLEQTGEGLSFVRNSEPEFLRWTLQESLGRLGTDYVDVYFIHWPDPLVPFDEVAGTLDELIAEGLIRHAGVSNFDTSQMDAYRSGGSLTVAQVPYNLFWRDVEDDVLPYCQRHGLGAMGYAALAQGFLTGTLSAEQEFAQDDWRAHVSLFQGEEYRQRVAVADRLKEFAAERDCTLPQLAIAWVLAHPAGVVPIMGAQVPEHVDSSVQATALELSADEAEQLRRVAAEAPPIDLSGLAPAARDSRA
ncbi:aldo/keto reductase [Egibacter rhizosphaerae]|uniref:Aldo/keto reductase n=1 Tax=Egibacter rhizosphaerae TaxID=1670831 RepID=A0A411YHX0_9ACTN|nr:aldo/keto reductase [Egibacter rhizosphaerae]QBI20813.1 aldo/keto reductase [Egibacter rhizosphaerae]